MVTGDRRDILEQFFRRMEIYSGAQERAFSIEFQKEEYVVAQRVSEGKYGAAFSEYIVQRDHLLCIDIRSGYHHFRLHTKMRNWFVCRNRERFLLSNALPFGWGRGVWWFCHLTKPVSQAIRDLGCLLRQWIEHFIIKARAEKVATPQDALALSQTIEELLRSLGTTLNPTKEVWGSDSTRIEPLGIVIDAETLYYTLPERKIEKMRGLAKAFMLEIVRNRRCVLQARLASICGVAASFSPAYPLAQLHSPALQYDLHRLLPNQRGAR